MYKKDIRKEKRKEQKNITEFEKLKKESPDLIFKPESLGAIEFTKKVLLKSFKQEEIKFRIERIPMETFGRIADTLENIDLKRIKELEGALKTFIAFPIEAREFSYYELDLDAMTSILGIATEFQATPFLYINGIRDTKERATV